MRMRRRFWFILSVLAAALLLAACTRMGDSPVEPANDGREIIPIDLSLAIAPLE